MNTRLNDSRGRRGGADPSRERKRPVKTPRDVVLGSVLPILLAGALLPGCGQTQGELLFLLGVGRGPMVEAKFHLTEGPILILIDDPAQQVDWPPAIRFLGQEVAQELLQHEAARKIVPPATLAHLRQSVAGFEKRGCREIGEAAGAEQVLWIEVRNFLADTRILDATVAAHFIVSVKVINVQEKERRSRVRLWPLSPRGHLVTVGLSAGEVAQAKTKDAIAKKMAGKLAAAIAKLFYDYRLGDFEREK